MRLTAPSLIPFEGEKYLTLLTYRKNGAAVQTPVWFAQQGGLLYVRTGAKSGKVKRIHNNPHVQVAPCDMAGKLHADWITAQGRLLDEKAAKPVNRLFRRKYGLQKVIFDLARVASRFEWATIEICPE